MTLQDELDMQRRLGHEEGIEEGIEKGLQEGRREEKKDIALNMIHNNMSLEEIAKLTGLSIEEVRALAESK